MNNAQQKTALIVDDEPEIIELMATEFESNGWRVVSALNGQQAMDKLRETDANLVVCDLLMPSMGGLELLKHVKAKDAQRPAFILVSGSVKLTEARNLHPDGQLTKPLSLSELVTMGENLISKR